MNVYSEYIYVDYLMLEKLHKMFGRNIKMECYYMSREKYCKGSSLEPPGGKLLYNFFFMLKRRWYIELQTICLIFLSWQVFSKPCLTSVKVSVTYTSRVLYIYLWYPHFGALILALRKMFNDHCSHEPRRDFEETSQKLFPFSDVIH